MDLYTGAKTILIEDKKYLYCDWTLSKMGNIKKFNDDSAEDVEIKEKLENWTYNDLSEAYYEMCPFGEDLYIYDSDMDDTLVKDIRDIGRVTLLIRKGFDNELNGRLKVVSTICGYEHDISNTYYFDNIDKAMVDLEYNVQMLWRIYYGWGSKTITFFKMVEELDVSGCYSCRKKFNEREIKIVYRNCKCPNCGEQFLMNRYTWKQSGNKFWDRPTFMTINECYEDAVACGLEFGENYDRGQIVKVEPDVDVKEIIESFKCNSEYDYLDLDFMDNDDVDLLSTIIEKEIRKRTKGLLKYDVEALYEKVPEIEEYE